RSYPARPPSSFTGAESLDLVSRGEFGEFLVAGEGRCQGDEGQEVAGVALVAQGQPPVPGEPGDGALDDPAVPAQFLAGFDSFTGDAGGDAPVAEPSAQVSLVIGLVRIG